MDKKQPTDDRDEIFRIRKVREDLNLSQDQFASILGISESTVKKIESYDRGLTVANLRRMHDKLGVSSDYILYGERSSREDAWEILLNCSEYDKVYLFLRLALYFAENRPEIYPESGGKLSGMEEFLRLITEDEDSKKWGEET